MIDPKKFATSGMVADVVNGLPIIPVTDAAIASMREGIARLRPEQRVQLFAQLAEGYCTACGEARTGRCHCENDE